MDKIIKIFNFSKRCDQNIDCLDESDEFHCDYLAFDKLYAKEIPPIKNVQDHLDIHINVSLLDIPYIDNYEMKFSVSFVLKLRWQDFRVVLKNLNENYYLNSLSKEDKNGLWTPEMEMTNVIGENQVLYDERTTSRLIKQSKPMKETKEHATEGMAKNKVHCQLLIYIKFLCSKIFLRSQ